MDRTRRKWKSDGLEHGSSDWRYETGGRFTNLKRPFGATHVSRMSSKHTMKTTSKYVRMGGSGTGTDAVSS